jgi:hypothetical protein
MTQPPFEPPTGPPDASALSGSPPGSVALGTDSHRCAPHHPAASRRPKRAGARTARSRLAWALAFTAISLAVTGAAAPASPATALTAPHAAITLHAQDPSSGWVTTTDPASSISVKLPGQPTVNKTTTTVEGKSIPIRTYVRKLSRSNGVVIFRIADAATGPADLDAAMQSAASSTGSNATVTSNRHFDLDGHPALDGRFTATTGKGTPVVGFVRCVSGDDHFVVIVTGGAVAQEDTLARVHQQVLDTLQLSEPPQ